MTSLDSILKSRGIILLTKVCLVKAMVFPVVMYGCESWTVKKAECRRIDAFELWCWRSLLRVPWTARRSNQSIWGWNVQMPEPFQRPHSRTSSLAWAGPRCYPSSCHTHQSENCVFSLISKIVYDSVLSYSIITATVCYDLILKFIYIFSWTSALGWMEASESQGWNCFILALKTSRKLSSS